MTAKNHTARHRWWVGGLVTGLSALVLVLTVMIPRTEASFLDDWLPWRHGCGTHGSGTHGCGTHGCGDGGPVGTGLEFTGEPGGVWYWMRSPDEEKRVVMALYSRYCIRCHGIDGHGVWDIPDVPNFANVAWQASRSDTQLARAILEGRGAVMPPFRGTLTLEEACAMARYLRTFVPGTEASRPDFGPGDKAEKPGKAAGPKN